MLPRGHGILVTNVPNDWCENEVADHAMALLLAAARKICRWIAGAGLDDIEEEPAKQREWSPANPLFSLDNVIITPHAAYYSEEAIRTVRGFAASEVVRVLTGQPPLSAVNAAQVADTRRAAGPRLTTITERRNAPELLGEKARQDWPGVSPWTVAGDQRRARAGRGG